MPSIELVAKLMQAKRRTIASHEKYLMTSREYMPDSNLYMREVHFVMAASPDEPVSVADIAIRLEVTAGAVSQLATRLEAKGFITRMRAEHDHRQTLVVLTDRGRKLYAHHQQYDQSCMARIVDEMLKITDEDLQKMIECEELFARIFAFEGKH